MSDSHDAPLRMVEDLPDIELLLLSWTQMIAVEMIVADEEALAAKADLAELLLEKFEITNLALKERTMDGYEITYRERGEAKSITFDIDEVESIYDL